MHSRSRNCDLSNFKLLMKNFTRGANSIMAVGESFASSLLMMNSFTVIVLRCSTGFALAQTGLKIAKKLCHSPEIVCFRLNLDVVLSLHSCKVCNISLLEISCFCPLEAVFSAWNLHWKWSFPKCHLVPGPLAGNETWNVLLRPELVNLIKQAKTVVGNGKSGEQA